ncbi:MAG: hypothetical protein ACJ8H8_16960, partial [Geminicoccaceae bacterium]
RGAIPDTEARIDEALARLRKLLAGKDGLADLRPSAGKRPRTERLKAAAGFLKSDPKAGDYVAVRREVFEAAVAPLPVALVLERLQRDGQLLTTPGRRGLWRQVLVQRLGAKRLPCACISAAFITD